jgi:hypothetical protein
MAGMVAAFALADGTLLLVALGLAVTLGNLASAWRLVRGLGVRLPESRARVRPAFVRAVGASLLMAGPAYLVATQLPNLLGGRLSALIAMLAAGIVGGAIFLAAQRAWQSPEFDFFVTGMLGKLRAER